MKKGIGPKGLGAPKSPAKQTRFNYETNDGVKLGKTEYANAYQNKELDGRKAGIRDYKIGDQETRMRSNHKAETAISTYQDSYTANKNKFGVKKPKVNIK